MTIDKDAALPVSASKMNLYSMSKWQGGRHVLTLLANGISGRKIARHAVFPLVCTLSLAMWNEK
jgi:hypothetical protein